MKKTDPLISENTENLQVFAEQIREIYRQIPFFVAGSHIGAVLTVALFWGKVPPVHAFVWLALIIFEYSIYLLMYYRFKRAMPSDIDMSKWSRQFVLLGWIATCTWGSIGFLFFVADSIPHQLVLIISLTIGAASVLATTTMYSQAFYSGVMLLVPLSLRLALEEGNLQQLLAGGLWIYIFLLFFLHRNVHKSYIRAQQLRFENISLAQELDKQKAHAEEANQAKSRFLGMASHDLRQPLHVLGMLLEQMRDKIHSPVDCKPVIERMETSIRTMNSFFSALLDMSKLDSGAVKPHIEKFAIDDLLSILEDDYKVRVQGKKLTFTVVHCSAYVESDPVLLRRIIGNLLENAVRYTTKGRILLGCRRRGDTIRVEVWDTGIGIDSADKERIFLEFEQLNNSAEKEQVKGIGLGLAVVKQMSSLLDHKIQLRSTTGKGSVFSIEIPISKVSLQTTTQQQPKHSVNIQDNLRGAHILVIDDDHQVLESLKGLLESWGCHVVISATVNAAIKQVEHNKFRPDLIVTDYCIPECGDGLKAVHRIHSFISTEIPAVVISGDVSAEAKEAIAAKGLSFLSKPVNPARLSTLLRFMLSGSDSKKVN